MIRVNDDWIVDVDPYNYILKRDMHKMVKDKKGEGMVPCYITKGYFSSLQAALERLGDELVRERLEVPEIGLREAVRTIEECRNEWRDLIGRIEA